MSHEEPRCPDATFSFELFPPRSAASEAALRSTIGVLAATRPEFISVTYGAGGSSREASLAVVRYLLEHTEVRPMAHLTCVGSSSEEASRLVREFLESGITSFLALRGDPPQDSPDGVDQVGDLRTASELVQLIHRVQAERAQYRTVASRSAPVGRLPEAPEKVRVAVATFPNGHARDVRDDQDIEALLAKQTSGATMAITQLFFEADDYLGFVARARTAGVTIPIVPGIMPATTVRRLERIVELTGERVPEDLDRQLRATDDAERRFDVGVGFATRLARRLLDGGASALHLYTFNQHRPVLAVLGALGLAAEPQPLPQHESQPVPHHETRTT